MNTVPNPTLHDSTLHDSTLHDSTLSGLTADLVALRHAGGYRFKVPARVLRQFVEHCRQHGYPDGSITKEAVDGFLYSRHLRASTVQRNELVLRQLAEHAQAASWDAHLPTTATRVRVRHQPPYVFTDAETTLLFTAIDSQPMSSFSGRPLTFSTGHIVFNALQAPAQPFCQLVPCPPQTRLQRIFRHA